MCSQEEGPPLAEIHYALRFISGKYQGGEFPLHGRAPELIIGRAADVDMVLVEDMVSRKHARIVRADGALVIEDLDSTNGTFVNGEKVRRTELREGDRILIGTSILKLVGVESLVEISADDARRTLEQTGARRATNASMRMSGIIDEIPLPDLMQLLSTSRKSGVLVVHSEWGDGRIYFRKGQIYFAGIDEGDKLGPRKAIYRMLGWESGTFSLEPPDEREDLAEISDTVEGLLMEGMRQLDELRRLGTALPRRAQLSIPVQLGPPLRELKAEELDLLQLVMSSGPSLHAILDQAPHTDLETTTLLASLVERGYVLIKK